MNIIEAHKSGRKFKRPSWDGYVKINLNNPSSYYIAFDNFILAAAEDILADDYELEPEAKLLTRAEVKEAFIKAAYCQYSHSLTAHQDQMLEILFGSRA